MQYHAEYVQCHAVLDLNNKMFVSFFAQVYSSAGSDYVTPFGMDWGAFTGQRRHWESPLLIWGTRSVRNQQQFDENLNVLGWDWMKLGGRSTDFWEFGTVIGNLFEFQLPGRKSNGRWRMNKRGQLDNSRFGKWTSRWSKLGKRIAEELS